MLLKNKSQFTNQIMTIKRNSSIYFSGALSLIEDKLYLKLQNFSFIHNNTSSEKQNGTKFETFLLLKSDYNSNYYRIDRE